MILDADPNNYMSYYKRATVFMALSRSRPALADLDRVIELKPDFVQARVQVSIICISVSVEKNHCPKITLFKMILQNGLSSCIKLGLTFDPNQVLSVIGY
jgi:hypothetical protein